MEFSNFTLGKQEGGKLMNNLNSNRLQPNQPQTSESSQFTTELQSLNISNATH